MQTGDKVRLRREATIRGNFLSGSAQIEIGATGEVIDTHTDDSGWELAAVKWDDNEWIPWSVVDQTCLFYTEKATLAQLKEVFLEGYNKTGPFDKTEYALKWVLEHYDLVPRVRARRA